MVSFLKKYNKIIAVLVSVIGIPLFAYALTILTVPQGGTGSQGFPINSFIISGTTTSNGGFSATSSPTVGWIYATSTTATSTFSNGVALTGGCFRLASGSCLTQGASLAGSDGQVIFNSGGTAFAGDTGLTFNSTSDLLTIAGGIFAQASSTLPTTFITQLNATAINATTTTITNLTVTASSTISSAYLANGNINIPGSITASSTATFLGGLTVSGGTVTFPAGFGGRSTTINGTALDADAELYNKIVSINVSSSTMSTTTMAAQHKFATAATLSRVSCSTDQGSTAIQLQERSEGQPNVATAGLLSAALSCDADTANTTSFSDAAVAADAVLTLQITDAQPTSTRATLLRVHIEVDYDD